jgi:hypothetical protein
LTATASYKGLRAAVRAAATAHPGERITLWFMDEARIGQTDLGQFELKKGLFSGG